MQIDRFDDGEWILRIRWLVLRLIVLDRVIDVTLFG